MKKQDIKIALLGLGQVGLRFIELLEEKKASLLERYQLNITVVAVADSSGAVIDQEGLVIDKLVQTKKQNGEVIAYNQAGSFQGTAQEAILQSGATIVVEASPTNLEDAEPALSHIKLALEHGISVATLNKGPIVHEFPLLAELAETHHCLLKYSGATAAALPTADIAFYSLAGTTIYKIEGILNGTSNYILSQMYMNEKDLTTAIKEAQEKGIAETDPSKDLQGWDTAAKTVILANTVMNQALKLEDIAVSGVDEQTFAEVIKWKKQGLKLKLIGEVTRESGQVIAKVSVKPLTPEHPLYHVEDTNKGIHYVTDTMGDLTVAGGKSDPRAAAAAALKDVILIATNK